MSEVVNAPTSLDAGEAQGSDPGGLSADLLARHRRSERSDKVIGGLLAVLPFVALIALWWGVHTVFDPSPTKLVAPSKVVDAFFESVREGVLPAYIVQSLKRLGFGVIIGVLVGIPLGWLLGLDKDIAKAAEPTLRFFNAVSGIAWLPLMISWFGFTER
ncbi:MAG: ABC transporter permease, partial [Acidimicrobiales bacterium]